MVTTAQSPAPRTKPSTQGCLRAEGLLGPSLVPGPTPLTGHTPRGCFQCSRQCPCRLVPTSFPKAADHAQVRGIPVAGPWGCISEIVSPRQQHYMGLEDHVSPSWRRGSLGGGGQLKLSDPAVKWVQRTPQRSGQNGAQRGGGSARTACALLPVAGSARVRQALHVHHATPATPQHTMPRRDTAL